MEMSLAAVDVHYGDPVAAAACITFESWTAASPSTEHVAVLSDVQAYVPGEFWKRELPCALKVLDSLKSLPGVIVVDGHVWLDNSGRKGLGAHLYEALDGRASVIGVAKNRFQGLSGHEEVTRGDSKAPLFVTSIGFNGNAGEIIAKMHGAHRVPTLLRHVDQLCRRELERAYKHSSD